jgi:hypothetical protein
MNKQQILELIALNVNISKELNENRAHYENGVSNDTIIKNLILESDLICSMSFDEINEFIIETSAR